MSNSWKPLSGGFNYFFANFHPLPEMIHFKTIAYNLLFFLNLGFFNQKITKNRMKKMWPPRNSHLWRKNPNEWRSNSRKGMLKLAGVLGAVAAAFLCSPWRQRDGWGWLAKHQCCEKSDRMEIMEIMKCLDVGCEAKGVWKLRMFWIFF